MFGIHLHKFKSKLVQEKKSYIESNVSFPCADPESFVRGGPTLTTFFFSSLEDPKTTKSGSRSARQRNANLMAFRLRVNGDPTLNAGLVAW